MVDFLIDSFKAQRENDEQIDYAWICKSNMRSHKGEPAWMISGFGTISARNSVIDNDDGEPMFFETREAALDYYIDKVSPKTITRFECNGNAFFDLKIEQVDPDDKSKGYYVLYLCADTASWLEACDEKGVSVFDTEEAAMVFVDDHVLKISQTPVSWDHIAAMASPTDGNFDCTGEDLIKEIQLFFDSPCRPWDTGRIYHGDLDRFQRIMDYMITLKYNVSHYDTTPIDYMIRDAFKHDDFLERHPMKAVYRNTNDDITDEELIEMINRTNIFMSAASDRIRRLIDMRGFFAHQREKEQTDG